MRNRQSLLIAGTCVFATTSLLIAPALGQERGGLTSTFSLNQEVRITRNPDLDPDGDDVRTVVGTNLSASISSVTRQSSLTATVGGQLRYAFGDVDADEDGLDFGRERIALEYRHRAPRVRFDTRVNYLRDDVSFLQPGDLLTDPDGGIVIVDDLADLQGTGTRENLRYRIRAQFDEDGPFGWGVSLSGSELNYSDVTSPSLVDRSTFNAALTAHLELTPTLRLDARLADAQRKTEDEPRTSTSSFALTATSVQSERLLVRAGLAYANPDTSDDRLDLSVGFTLNPTRQNELSVDVGASISDGFDTRLTGRVEYSVQPTRLSQFNFQLRSEVLDSADNDVVVNTVALAGFNYALTSQSSISINTIFADEEDLTSGVDTTNISGSVQYNRRLNRDWQMSVGLSARNRRVSNEPDASSQEIFVTFGRAWQGRF